MKNIRIEYNQRKCIGAQKCVEIAPEYFSFDGEKAFLQLASVSEKEGIHTLHFAASPTKLKMFVQAAESCPVNAIKIIDADEQKVLVDTEVILDKEKIQRFSASYDDLKEFVMDPVGYFLIRIDPLKKVIEVGLCRELNKVAVTVTGKKPLEIYQTIIKCGLLSRLDHAAYLGRELQKAYIALQKGIPYVQDDELGL